MITVIKEKNKADRIAREERRIKRIYKNVPRDSKAIVEGLIQRAAYMRVTLEDYERDLDEKGYIEMFTQSDKTDPYERERPVARLYNTMNKNYQSLIKQLSDLLPDAPLIPPEDDFDKFVNKP